MTGNLFKVNFEDRKVPVVKESLPVTESEELLRVIELVWELFQAGESLEAVKRSLLDQKAVGDETI
jgi:hypothetical protein